MKKIVLVVAFTVMAAFPLTTADAQSKSNWTVEFLTKPMNEAPAGFNPRAGFATIDQETVQPGVPVVDADYPPSHLRVGVFARITTNGADPSEGLTNLDDKDYPDGYMRGDTVLGLDRISLGLFLSGTGIGGHRVSELVVAQPLWRSMVFPTELATLKDLLSVPISANGTTGLALNNEPITHYSLVLNQGLAGTTPFRGVWCKVEQGNSCEIFLGVLEIPSVDLPTGLDTFSVAIGPVEDNESKLVPTNVASWGTRATVTAVTAGAPTTYNMCTGASCDRQLLGFASSAYTVTEGNTTASSVDVVVNYSGRVTESDIGVTLIVSDPTAGQAATNADYELSETTITIPAGSASVSVPITVRTKPNTTPGQGNRTFVLTMATDYSNVILGTPATTVTILEDDNSDTVTLTLSTYRLAEGAPRTPVTVTATVDRQTSTAGDLTVHLTLGGTATAGADYTTGDDETTEEEEMIVLTIPPGSDEATTTISITPVRDRIPESDESISFEATATWVLSDAPLIPTPTPAELTIINHNDDRVGVTVARKDGETGAVAEGAQVTFTATFTDPVEGVTISWNPNPDLEGTSATVASTETSDGAHSADFAITVVDDAIAEVRETMSIVFQVDAARRSAQEALDANPLTFDVAPSDPITIALTGPDTGREGAVVDFVAVIGGGTPTSDLVLSIGVGAGGTAQAADIQLPTQLTQTLPLGATSATFSVAIVDDGFAAIEIGETLELTVSGNDGVGTPVTAGRTTTTILQLPGVDIVANAARVNEDSGTAEFTVSLSRAVDVDFTLDWIVVPGTDGTDDDDFTAISGTLVFHANEAADQTIALGIIDDQLAEMGEDFTVSLSFNAASRALESRKVELGTDTSATVTIADNDRIVLALAGPVSAREGDSATYTVTVVNGVVPAADITLDIEVDRGSGANATGAGDLGSVPATASITLGDTSATFEIPISEDSAGPVGTGKQFTVIIRNPTGGGGTLIPLIITPRVTTTITQLPIVDISTDADHIREDAGSAGFTVTLSDSVDEDVVVDWSIAHDTTDDEDFSATAGSITFAADSMGSGLSQTVPIRVVNDRLAELPEDFSVIVRIGAESASLTNSKLEMGNPRASVTIDDNDPIQIALSGPEGAHEGGNAEFTLTVVDGVTPTTDVTLNVVLEHDATQQESSASDLNNSAPATVTIPSGSSSTTFVIGVADDLYDAEEVGEQFSVTIEQARGGGGTTPPTISADSVITTILQPPSIDIATITPSVSEEPGVFATFAITLSVTGALTEPVAVRWAVVHTATVSRDFRTATSGTVTFSAHGINPERRISIMVRDDSFPEYSEQFAVELSGPPMVPEGGRARLGTASASATIETNDVLELVLDGPSTANEGTSPSYAVSVVNRFWPTADVILDVSVLLDSGVNAASSADFLRPPTVATLSAGTRSTGFAIPLIAERPELVESDETFTVMISESETNTIPVTISTPSVTTTITESLLDINYDQSVTAEDALALYYSLVLPELIGNGSSFGGGFTSLRRGLLSPLQAGLGELDRTRTVARAQRWLAQRPDDHDLNLDGSVDAIDALVLFYALSLETDLGDGTVGSGDEDFRRAFLQQYALNADDDGLRAMLRRAHAVASGTVYAGVASASINTFAVPH